MSLFVTQSASEIRAQRDLFTRSKCEGCKNVLNLAGVLFPGRKKQLICSKILKNIQSDKTHFPEKNIQFTF